MNKRIAKKVYRKFFKDKHSVPFHLAERAYYRLVAGGKTKRNQNIWGAVHWLRNVTFDIRVAEGWMLKDEKWKEQ